MNDLTWGKKLSWYLKIVDLKELKEHSYIWYRKNLDYSNLFSFTGEGDFYFSRNLEKLPPEDWNYLISIIGASCVGFILNIQEETRGSHISIWRMEGGSITACKKELPAALSSERILKSVIRQVSETDREVVFHHNWDFEMADTTIKGSTEDIDIFSAANTRSFAARLHLEMTNPPDKNPGDFSRYRLR
ncbi:MAG: hypothetical protein ACTSRU_02695 [Candidatus Hodarchaeales archaeon]